MRKSARGGYFATMRGAAVPLLLVLALAAGTAALAQDQSAEAPSAKRQLAICMSRRMASNRLLSYNDAAKSCKDQLKGRKPETASILTTKPVS